MNLFPMFWYTELSMTSTKKKKNKHAGSFSFLFSVIKISLHNIYEASIAKIRETGKKKKKMRSMIESPRLEKAFKLIQSNCKATTSISH